MIADGTDWDSQSMSGDVAIDNTGATTIQADAVTLAKMASGTAGNLITYDASGNPAVVATGTAGQVLTSNGAGAAPTFQAASGSTPTITYVKGTASITSYAACGGTAKPVGGGCELDGGTDYVHTSCPGTAAGCSTTPTGWYCSSSDTFVAYVICLE